MPHTDPEVYHASLRHYGYGYGLFQPELTQKLRPGQCGYIDESGRWQPLLDLTDNQLLVAAGYSPVDPLQRSDPDYQTWEPRVANTVKGIEVKLEGDTSALAAGLPFDASVAVKYSTSAKFGAILMCDDKVVVECYDLKDPFRAWLFQNASKLLATYPTLKERGLYVATTTYSSSDIHINVWNSSKDEITLGFKVGITGIGGLNPSVRWMRGRATHGWSHFVTEGGRKVMFFSGIKIKFRKLHLGANSRFKEVPQSDWRGAGDKFSVINPAEEGGVYEAELETLGDDGNGDYDEIEEEDEEEEEAEDDLEA